MARIRTIKPEFWTDGAVMDLSMAARLLFIGTWNFAICDAGHIPDDPRRLKMQILPADDVDAVALVDELIAAGRVARIHAGGRSFLHIVRFLDHQKTEKRWSPRCPACQHIEGHAQPPQTTPNHAEPLATSAKLSDTHQTSAPEGKGEEGKGEEGNNPKDTVEADAPTIREPAHLELVDRPDVDRLCALLADQIEANGSKRPTVGKGWHDAARLMLDRDNRTEDQVAAAIRWAQGDEFWRTNILSMPKLREKYDQLRLAAHRARAPAGRPRNDIDWDAAAARAAARDAMNGAT